jgi:hypothetical protein
MSGLRVLPGLLVSLAHVYLIGALIQWHAWRSRRTTGPAKVRHVRALLRLAAVCERQERKMTELMERYR